MALISLIFPKTKSQSFKSTQDRAKYREMSVPEGRFGFKLAA
jgi:hypothetical protein